MLGDHIEFYSPDCGGVWKPGVVSPTMFYSYSDFGERAKSGRHSHLIRICVGEGVYILRPMKACRAMSVISLPIDVIPNTNPPKFRWKQTVDSVNGKQVIAHEGVLPAPVELAVQRLIAIAKQLLMDNATLHGTIDKLNERIARVEAPTAPTPKKGK